MMKFIDISYQINSEIAIYPGNPKVEIKRVQSIEDGDSTNVSEIKMGSHTGTHIDAPAHWIKGGKTLDKIPLDRMNGKAKIFDMTGYDDIDEKLLKKCNIEKDDIVLLKTNNSLNWNCDRILEDYVTLTYDGAEYLADKEIKLVGVDYLTIERPRSKRDNQKSVHEILLSKEIIICEALKLKEVEAGEYDFLCLPPNIEGIDGGAVRCVCMEKQRKCDCI